jgi:hypothetical protein
MPRQSVKSQCLKNILVNATGSVLSSDSDARVDDELMDCVVDFLTLQQFRYVGPRDVKIPKSRDWFIKILPNYDDGRFKGCLRVSRDDFALLFGLISQNEVFKSDANKKMISTETQLAIALYRFGCNGSGVSFWKIGLLFGLSDGGTVRNCTDRVIKVLLICFLCSFV